MNITLWIFQILIGAMFIMAGTMKAFQYEKVKEKMPWVKDVSKSMVNFIGFAELFGGIGLIVPQAIGVLPVLTSLAAAGIGAIMILASLFHLKRKEVPGAITNFVVLGMCLFVAYGRL